MQEIGSPCPSQKTKLTKHTAMTYDTTEGRILALHNTINARGVQVDTDLLEGAISIVNQMRLRAQTTIRRITKSQSGEKPKALAAWLSQKIGCEIESVSNQALEFIQEYATDRDILRVVQARMILNRTSLSKFQAIADRLDIDGRLRNMYVYQGAHTGRWTSVDVQLHNLPRSGMGEEELEKAVAAISTGDYSYANMIYGQDLPDVLAGLIRACFTAPKGRMLAVADYSAIEARVLAWLADEQWKLHVFRTTGRIYEETAARMLGGREDQVTKEQRNVGKVADLALGFGGGVGAIIRMGGQRYGWTKEQMEDMVHSWRFINRRITRYWMTLERRVKKLWKGVREDFGKITLLWEDDALIISLPSGRELTYPGLQKSLLGISYLQDGERKPLYGGLLTENIVQAIARDILAEAMLKVEGENDYSIVMHTHDELVVEVKDCMHEGNEVIRDWDLQEIIRRMETAPAWAEGLPLKVEGFVTRHYTK